MAKVILTQTRSQIRAHKRQKATLKALGLGRISQTVEHESNPQIEGMIAKVAHLLNIERK